MYMTLAMFLVFFALPAWGGYNGGSLLLWVLVALALLGAAGGCMWLQYRKERIEWKQ